MTDSNTKILTECSYCNTYFDDIEESGICDSCIPLYFLDRAVIDIYNASKDIQYVRDEFPDLFARRKKEIEGLLKEIKGLNK